ncbi:MAG: type II secretion system GspH family protein [Oscillatoria princeps RMCB-10]|jgi:prepilin-type N-terminal cleavage/methylation domain-containing protein|nr:type II secretion system GspH family protein [Oscillatoria princeps RMCB-10]
MTAITSFLKRRKRRQLESHSSTAGFTMIELMAVVAIVGILAAISGAGYLGWMARMRVNKVQDTALQAIRQAQTTARQKKGTWKAIFQQQGDQVQWAVNVDQTTPTSWNTIDEPDVILTVASWEVSFDYKGQIPSENSLPPKLVLSNKNGGNKRCVIVKTILGAVSTARDADCN